MECHCGGHSLGERKEGVIGKQRQPEFGPDPGPDSATVTPLLTIVDLCSSKRPSHHDFLKTHHSTVRAFAAFNTVRAVSWHQLS